MARRPNHALHALWRDRGVPAGVPGTPGVKELRGVPESPYVIVRASIGGIRRTRVLGLRDRSQQEFRDRPHETLSAGCEAVLTTGATRKISEMSSDSQSGCESWRDHGRLPKARRPRSRGQPRGAPWLSPARPRPPSFFSPARRLKLIYARKVWALRRMSILFSA